MKQATPVLIAALIAVAVALTSAFLWKDAMAPTAVKPPHAAGTNQQVYTVTGTVVSADDQSGILRVAHDEIPGYMDAMTMPFLAREANSLRGLKTGDRVAFNLVVTDNDSWVTAVQKLGTDNASSFAAKAEATRNEREAERVQPGEKVPAFALTNQFGEAFTLQQYAGKAVIVNFIYTSCPLPNFCPLLSKKTSELQARLETEFPGRFHIISVSIDPARDTPAVLKAYAERYTTNLQTWSFGTGSPETIHEVAGYFGLIYEAKNGLVDHDLRTALIGPDQRLVHIWRSNFWTPYEIRTRIEESLANKQAAGTPGSGS